MASCVHLRSDEMPAATNVIHFSRLLLLLLNGIDSIQQQLVLAIQIQFPNALDVRHISRVARVAKLDEKAPIGLLLVAVGALKCLWR